MIIQKSGNNLITPESIPRKCCLKYNKEAVDKTRVIMYAKKHCKLSGLHLNHRRVLIFNANFVSLLGNLDWDN